jgi:hypothetical protein
MEIMLPHIPDAVVVVEDMLGKVVKLNYVDHEVTYMTKFPDLVQEIYLESKGEAGPSRKPNLEPAQWIEEDNSIKNNEGKESRQSFD